MDRVAVFVDAGYLFAQGSKEISGRQLRRGEISLDHQTLIRLLKDFAENVSGLPLLRIHWYDGTSQGPTPQHNTLADQADMKVRLGFVNSAGRQKGVDSLIVTDMISLARNRAMADCVLLSGDEDLRVGVQQAQEYGVRVHLLGIRPARGSQSLFLLREVDSSHEWSSDVLRDFLKHDSEGVEPMDADGRPESRAPAASHATEAVLPDTDGQSDHGRTLQQVARQVADDLGCVGNSVFGPRWPDPVGPAVPGHCSSSVRTGPPSLLAPAGIRRRSRARIDFHIPRSTRLASFALRFGSSCCILLSPFTRSRRPKGSARPRPAPRRELRYSRP